VTAFEHLGAPLTSGALRLKNRIAHASILTRYAAGERATDRLVAYHENRARGGAAMIVTEAVNALPSQAGRGGYLNAHDDAGLPDLARLATAVTRHGTRLLAQIQERGRGNYSRSRVDRTVAPSPLPDDLTGAVPHPLSTGDVEAMIDDFAAAAARLQRAGFDGVEVSAGHGHLFHQFLSAHSNRRTDRYGGDVIQRTRLLQDLIAAIRTACGRDFVLGLKLPAEDGDPDGIDLAQAERITTALADPDAIDYLAFAWGAQNRRLHWHVPDAHQPRMPYAEKTARLRRSANGLPVMALGRIVDPNEAEAILARGQADVIGVGRALIADPHWPEKALQGRSHAIRACVSCNTCWGAIAEPAALVCDTNPDLGTAREVERPAGPALSRRRQRVVVVGGGVAGLAAAAEAGSAGHEVALFHRGNDLGGRAVTAARLPGGDGVQGVYDFDAERARAANVRVELGVTAGADAIGSLAPDHVVLATGANMPWPGDPDLEDLLPSLRALVEAAFNRAGVLGRHLVVIAGEDTIWTYRAAELLSRRFECISVITEREIPAASEPLVVRQGLLERLGRGRIGVITSAEALVTADDLEAGGIRYRDLWCDEERALPAVDMVVHASPRRPRTGLLDPLVALGLAPIVIGDAFQPRALMHAVAEGRRAGRSI
jgi:2,4-dienoyl-CoA reductase-like NADH-dependent reductase (Old Yellow Enzyme family)/thioredoxin reductase